LIYSNNLQSWIKVQLCIRILICIDIQCITFYRIRQNQYLFSKAPSRSSRISGLRASSVVTSSTPRRFIDADRQLSRNRSTRCPVMRRILRARMPEASIDRLEYRLISPGRYRGFTRATPKNTPRNIVSPTFTCAKWELERRICTLVIYK